MLWGGFKLVAGDQWPVYVIPSEVEESGNGKKFNVVLSLDTSTPLRYARYDKNRLL